MSARCIAVSKRNLRSLGDEAPHGGFPNTGRPAGHGSDHSIHLSHFRFLVCSGAGGYEPKMARYRKFGVGRKLRI
jgi:hypothetical protein